MVVQRVYVLGNPLGTYGSPWQLRRKLVCPPGVSATPVRYFVGSFGTSFSLHHHKSNHETKEDGPPRRRINSQSDQYKENIMKAKSHSNKEDMVPLDRAAATEEGCQLIMLASASSSCQPPQQHSNNEGREKQQDEQDITA